MKENKTLATIKEKTRMCVFWGEQQRTVNSTQNLLKNRKGRMGNVLITLK